jgi:hypothetical protein
MRIRLPGRMVVPGSGSMTGDRRQPACRQILRAVSGRAVSGRAVDGRAVDGRAVDGRAVDGRAVDGPAVDGPTVDGRAVDGAAVHAIDCTIGATVLPSLG